MLRTFGAWLALGCLALTAPAPAACQLGLCPDPVPGVAPGAPRQWAREAGAGLSRLRLRADLWRAPGGRLVPDQAIAADAAAGVETLLELSPAPARADGRRQTPLPDGLAEPVFADGTDSPWGQAALNPANLWAQFVAEVVERYDGDGQADAPGAPIVRRYAVNLPAPAGDPLPAAGLARLVQVAAIAARAADSSARLGLRPDSPEQLAELLAALPRHGSPTLAFVDFTVPPAVTVDRLVAGPDGLAGLAARYRAVLWDAGVTAELLATVGFPAAPAEGRLQRAAVVQSLVVGAAERLAGVSWAAVSDPSPGQVGLLGDARLLSGAGQRRAGVPPARPAWIAWRSAASLLGEALASGQLRLDEEVSVGNDAVCYRFRLGDDEVLVAWSHDDGDADRTAALRLPLARGVAYYPYRWDYTLTGRAAAPIVGGDDGYETVVGIDPEFYITGPERLTAAVAPPPPVPPSRWRVTCSHDDAAAPGWLAIDGDPTTAWVGPGEAGAWWTLDVGDGVLTTRRIGVIMSPRSGSVSVEISDDGIVWQPVSTGLVPAGYAPHRLELGRRVSSRWWRLRFAPAAEPVRLAEVTFTDGPEQPAP